MNREAMEKAGASVLVLQSAPGGLHSSPEWGGLAGGLHASWCLQLPVESETYCPQVASLLS